MARERYLLNDTEDTIHQNQIKPTTGKEKRENWWFYHKVHLIVGVIAVVFAVAIVWSFVSKDNPDYNVAIMTEYVLPTDLQLDLEEHIEQYADDRNGDGEVMVQLLCYTFPTGGTSDYDIAQLQASFVKFAADANAGDTMIFLYDDASYNYLDQNDMDGFFGPVDDSGEEYVLFSDMAGLNNLQLNHYAEEGDLETVMNVLGSLKVAVRSTDASVFEKEEIAAYRQDSIALFERLKTGEKPQTAAE